jgi:hypothetical protein
MTGTREQLDGRPTKDWTEDEVEYYLLGPFDGEVSGLVRRIRRILDVSQRGLAKLRVDLRNQETGEVVEPMRDVYGTPVDHPARHQLIAEALHIDEVREECRRQAREKDPRLPSPRPPRDSLTA